MTQAQNYITAVLSGKELVCELTKLAVERHVSDLKKQKDKAFEFVFSEKEANKYLSIIRLFRHTAGDFAGKPFNMQDNQAFFFAMLFGWRRKNNGRRRFTQVYKEVARKYGKSEEGAVIEIITGFFEGEKGAQVFTAATTRDQAEEVFRAVKIMSAYLRNDSPRLRADISVMANAVNYAPTNSFIQKVSADAGTLDGKNSQTTIIDEYHAHKTDLVKGVMQTSMGSRTSPLLMIITTAGFEKEYPCYQVERKNAVAVLKGERRQDNLLAMIFTLDEGEAELLMSLDPDTTADATEILRIAKKSNPNIGSTPTNQFILDQVRDARNKGSSTRVQVLTKNFNVWTDAPKVWIPEEVVKAVMIPLDLKEMFGRVAFGGIDLASVSDINAYALFFPPIAQHPATVKIFYWLPEDAVEKHKSDTSYIEWIEQGYLLTTPGNITDYGFIEKHVVETSQQVQIKSVSYDQWNAYATATNLQGEGLEMLVCRQTYSHVSEPLRTIERLLVAGDLILDYNPVTLWMFRNVALDFDPNDNIKLNKKKAGGKIDGIAATAGAVFGWLTAMGQPETGSYLDRQELLVI